MEQTIKNWFGYTKDRAGGRKDWREKTKARQSSDMEDSTTETLYRCVQ